MTILFESRFQYFLIARPGVCGYLCVRRRILKPVRCSTSSIRVASRRFSPLAKNLSRSMIVVYSEGRRSGRFTPSGRAASAGAMGMDMANRAEHVTRVNILEKVRRDRDIRIRPNVGAVGEMSRRWGERRGRCDGFVTNKGIWKFDLLYGHDRCIS